MSTRKSRALPPVPLLAHSGLKGEEIDPMAQVRVGDRALAALVRRTLGVWFDPPVRVEAGEDDYDEEAYLDRGEEPPTHVTLQAGRYLMPHHVLAAAVVLGGKPGPLVSARSVDAFDAALTILHLPTALAVRCVAAWNRGRGEWERLDGWESWADEAIKVGAPEAQTRERAARLAARLNHPSAAA